MNWEQLLSLKCFGDTNKRIRKAQDEMRLGFEVDYDRIIFSSEFRSLQVKTQVIPLPQTIDFSDKLLYVRLLNVNHFVASLSDSHAILSYKKLLGLKFDRTYS